METGEWRWIERRMDYESLSKKSSWRRFPLSLRSVAWREAWDWKFGRVQEESFSSLFLLNRQSLEKETALCILLYRHPIERRE